MARFRPLQAIFVFLPPLFLAAMSMAGCTIKATPVPPGMIPRYTDITMEEQTFGQKLFENLNDDFDVITSHERYGQLLEVWAHLLETIEADYSHWQLIMFNQPNMIDVRAVHGNYVFVWSGFLDFAETEDEMAAVLAGEMAHVLADHTNPVQYTALSKILFSTGEIATSIGLMFLSQGAVAVGGQGWMEHIYTDIVDLDPLDREYSKEEVRDALRIAYLMMERSRYSPQAMITFWNRVREKISESNNQIQLDRSISIEERLKLMEELLPAPPIKNDLRENSLDYTQEIDTIAPPL